MKKLVFTGRKTVADGMSVFNKAIADLKAVEEAQNAEHDKQDAIAEAVHAAASAHREAVKAASTRAKLEALLNG